MFALVSRYPIFLSRAIGYRTIQSWSREKIDYSNLPMNPQDYRSSTSIARTMMGKLAFPPKRSFFDARDGVGVVWIIASYIRWTVYDVHVRRWRRPRKINDSARPRVTASRNVLLEKAERRNAHVFPRSTNRRRSRSASLPLAFSPAPPRSGSTIALGRLSPDSRPTAVSDL